MPVISMFYGIIVSLYYMNNRQHHTPHIHVREAAVSIPDGEVIDSRLQSNKMKLVQAWNEIHRDELMADWELAINGEEVFKIDPLK